MILDASVLIDLLDADRTVFRHIADHIGPVYVASVVVNELRSTESEDVLVELGLLILETEIEDAYTAVTWTGPTSFQDNICLLTAKRYGGICVTNDKSLRKLCVRENVPILWGLELLGELYNAGGISKKKVIEIAEYIHQLNPYHITADILQRFIFNLEDKRSKFKP